MGEARIEDPSASDLADYTIRSLSRLGRDISDLSHEATCGSDHKNHRLLGTGNSGFHLSGMVMPIFQ